jgi:hypothetical protein
MDHRAVSTGVMANLKQASNYRSALAARYQAQPAIGRFKHPTPARLEHPGEDQASARLGKKRGGADSVFVAGARHGVNPDARLVIASIG